MKIVKGTCEQVAEKDKRPPFTIANVQQGQVFTSETVWPNRVFMRIWSAEESQIKFASLDPNAPGGTFSTSKSMVRAKPGRYEATILKASLCIEE